MAEIPLRSEPHKHHHHKRRSRATQNPRLSLDLQKQAAAITQKQKEIANALASDVEKDDKVENIPFLRKKSNSFLTPSRMSNDELKALAERSHGLVGFKPLKEEEVKEPKKKKNRGKGSGFLLSDIPDGLSPAEENAYLRKQLLDTRRKLESAEKALEDIKQVLVKHNH